MGLFDDRDQLRPGHIFFAECLDMDEIINDDAFHPALEPFWENGFHPTVSIRYRYLWLTWATQKAQIEYINLNLTRELIE